MLSTVNLLFSSFFPESHVKKMDHVKKKKRNLLHTKNHKYNQQFVLTLEDNQLIFEGLFPWERPTFFHTPHNKSFWTLKHAKKKLGKNFAQRNQHTWAKRFEDRRFLIYGGYTNQKCFFLFVMLFFDTQFSFQFEKRALRKVIRRKKKNITLFAYTSGMPKNTHGQMWAIKKKTYQDHQTENLYSFLDENAHPELP